MQQEQEMLTESGFQLHLYATEMEAGFLAARTGWLSGQFHIEGMIVYRKAFAKRDGGYFVAVWRFYPACRFYLGLERSLDGPFMRLRDYGYSGSEAWLVLSREQMHHCLTSREQECLWNANLFGQNLFSSLGTRQWR